MIYNYAPYNEIAERFAQEGYSVVCFSEKRKLKLGKYKCCVGDAVYGSIIDRSDC